MVILYFITSSNEKLSYPINYNIFIPLADSFHAGMIYLADSSDKIEQYGSDSKREWNGEGD